MKIPGDWKTYENDKIDKIGSLLYMISIGLIIYGFSALITQIGQICVIVGIILGIIYVLFELRQESPVFDVRLFKIKTFASYNVAGMFGFFAAMNFTTLINYYFQYVKGFGPELTGFILIVSPVVMSITAPIAGRLSDRIHPQKLAAIGMAIATISMILLSFLDQNTPMYIIIIAMALQALGTGLFSSPNMNAIVSSVDEKDAAFASAGQLTTRAIGQAMSLGLLTVVFSWIMGDLVFSLGYASLIVRAIQIIFIVCVFTNILSIVASFIGIRADHKITR